VTNINFRENQIDDHGVAAMVEILKVNTSLTFF
jgi:hypothetical protein